MRVNWVVMAIISNIIYVENKMIPMKYLTLEPMIDDDVLAQPIDKPLEAASYERVLRLNNINRQNAGYDARKPIGTDKIKKPCSIVVLSNVQNPNMQSLLRKYRYDANGMLIPSSVKYFIKMPQGYGTAPVLVPLNDKAFSPLGGFVRYYKEVPPIPQSW